MLSENPNPQQNSVPRQAPDSQNPPQKENEWDASLRPTIWQDYIGQEKIKNNLRMIIDSAKKRSEPLEHLLFYGNSGLGKTTLAYVVAKEMHSQMKICSGKLDFLMGIQMLGRHLYSL